MSLPNEQEARAALALRHADLFARGEGLHSAAVEVLTRGKLVISKTEDFNEGILMLIVSLLTKACKTFRAIQLTTEGGLGQDASVLARQLFETAVAVKFILREDTRTRAAMFAAHEDQRALVLAEQAHKAAGPHVVSAEMVERARAKVKMWESVLPAETIASVRTHWSGKSLEAAARDVDFLHQYAVMYRYTSAFAHGSDAHAHFFVRKGGTSPTIRIEPSDDEIEPVLDGSMALLGMMIELANDAFGLGEEAVVNRMRAECRTPKQLLAEDRP